MSQRLGKITQTDATFIPTIVSSSTTMPLAPGVLMHVPFAFDNVCIRVGCFNINSQKDWWPTCILFYSFLFFLDDITRFREAGFGKLDCSSLKATGILTSEECRLSAVTLGITFKGTEKVNGYPKGCYVYRGKIVVWNSHGTGGTNANASPVCKLGLLKLNFR